MKPSNFFWLLCAGAILLIVAAFVAGRYFEKTTALQCNVTALTGRVNQLEAANMKREERWSRVRWVGSLIPVVRHLIGQ